jgi:hypothetical protein
MPTAIATAPEARTDVVEDEIAETLDCLADNVDFLKEKLQERFALE